VNSRVQQVTNGKRRNCEENISDYKTGENTAPSQSRSQTREDITIFYGIAETAIGDDVVEVELSFIEGKVSPPDATCSSPRVIKATCPANNAAESVLVSFPTWSNRTAWLLLLMTIVPDECTGRLASFGVRFSPD